MIEKVRCYAIVALWGLGSVTGLYAQKPVSGRPNIIVVVTDDHRWDALGVAGNPIVKTPHLDSLANRGINFRNAYVTTSICAVSRASILTGQYLSRHGINNFVKNFSPEAFSQTYPMLLKAAGYTTAFIGKFGVGNSPPAEYFDYWMSTEPEGNDRQPPYVTLDANGKEIHDTDTIGRAIRKFLGQYGTSGPFCLSVSFKAPHELDGDPPTYVVQDRYKQGYREEVMPVPRTASNKYVERLPPFLRSEANIGRKRWEGLLGTPALFQENVKNYYRLITGVDEVIGSMVATLRQLGIADQTAIVFLGDNGMLLGEHGLEGKWYGYEESIRIPLLIDYAGLPSDLRGSKPEVMALNIDVAPTILALAGLDPPGTLQGHNLLGVLEGAVPDRDDFFYQHYFMGSPKIPQVEGVVSRRFKYMNFMEHGYEELFDINRDPRETTNLIDRRKYRRELDVLRERLVELKEAAK
ncbi:sulfatase [Parapedobacter sp. 2B3]|uniref:sulfatase family protein n=1 Tax=Parapedobacter sp. 2B3 TaxID=3342381 RepID=UPI0035B63873